MTPRVFFMLVVLVTAGCASAPPGNGGQPDDVFAAMGGELELREHRLYFTECLSGHSYTVASEGDIGRTHQASVDAGGEPVYVTIEGSINGDHVVVRRFINAWPGENCERARANASLVNTYWRVDRLGGDAVRTAEGMREPHVILRAEQNARYGATVGCNQMGGNFLVDGERITFSPGPTTLMACPPPLDELERRLGGALARARHWRIIGNTLELMDESRASLALFEAVYL